MRIYIPYDRFSSGPQKEGTSKERQDFHAAEVAAREGWTPHPTLSFRDPGCSALRGKHRLGKHRRTGGMADLLAGIRNKVIKPGWIIAIESFSRFSREPLNTAFNHFQEILHAGVDICICVPFAVYTEKDLHDFKTMMFVQLEIERAHQESRTKRDYAKAQWRRIYRRAKEGETHRMLPPAWLEARDGEWVFRPDRKAIVEQIIEWYRQQVGVPGIVHRLMADPHRYPAWGRCGQWRECTIKRLLADPALWGALQRHTITDEGNRIPDGDPIPGYYPPVLSREGYEDLQRLKRLRKRTAGGRPPREGLNLLAGLVRNSAGNRLSLMTSWTEGRVYTYLTPRAEYARASGVKAERIPYAMVEHVLLELIPNLNVAQVSPAEDKMARNEQALQALRHERDQNDQAIAMRERVLADVAATEPAVRAAMTALGQLYEERERIAARLRDVDSASSAVGAALLDQARPLVEARRTATKEERLELDRKLKGLLPSLIEGVWTHAQVINHRSRWIHVQVWLRNGECHYTRFATGCRMPRVGPLSLGPPVDFRKGLPRT